MSERVLTNLFIKILFDNVSILRHLVGILILNNTFIAFHYNKYI